MHVDRSRDDLLTIFGKDTLSDRYLLPGESFQDLFARVASAYGDDAGHAQRLYDYMSRHWFMPATPVLSNGGTDRGLPISCYLNEVNDDMHGIVGAWNENVWLAARGGGIGTYWGNLRSIGESVRGVGKTSGVIPFIRVQDSLTLAISQGSLRRGSAAVYLDVWHPEIEEFIDIRRATGGDPNRKAQNLHHGVLVSDAFMRAVEADEMWALISPKDQSVVRSVSARALWIRLLTARIETGEPYLIFSDAVNRAIPEHHKLAGLSVKTSNLCVAPETLLLTDKGEFPIEKLAGYYVDVWNGWRWTPAIVAKTGENQKLIRVCLSNGRYLDCTPYHKFYLSRREKDHSETSVEVQAGDLKPGDELVSYLLPECYPDNPIWGVHVVDVTDNGRVEDTYCVNEPERHMAVFNGILTGNCSEITLPTGIDQHGKDRTAVCCLSSLNLEYWLEWRDHPTFIDDVMRFLDNVLQDFIDRAPAEMEKAKYSAMRERSVGLGVMGFHSFLQAQNVPWESVIAKSWNMKMFHHIRKEVDSASRMLAYERGPCPDAAEYDMMARFSCKMSLAPTASISIIAGGASPGIEPIATNAFLQKTLSGSHIVRNRHLKKLLASKDQDTDDVWSSITLNKGSVQHLDFLTEHEKMVYRTAFELDQRWVVEHAADRTPFVCQSQSVNLFLPANVHKRDLHQIHMMAWKSGLKSLYYCRSMSIQRADNVSEKAVRADAPTASSTTDYDECLSCQ